MLKYDTARGTVNASMSPYHVALCFIINMAITMATAAEM